jgi:hypothetical protein
MYQLQGYGFSTPGTVEGVFSEGVEEGLGEGFSGQDAIASGIGWSSRGLEAIQDRSHPGVADVSMQAVVSDALESFGQDMLDHSSDESDHVQGGPFDFSGLMIPVPISNGLCVILYDASDADGEADDVLGQVMSQPLSAGRDLSALNVGDQSLGATYPSDENITPVSSRNYLFI